MLINVNVIVYINYMLKLCIIIFKTVLIMFPNKRPGENLSTQNTSLLLKLLEIVFGLCHPSRLRLRPLSTLNFGE